MSSLALNLAHPFTGSLAPVLNLNLSLARANTILDHHNNGEWTFVRQILVPIAQKVFATKETSKKEPVAASPSADNIYNILVEKRNELVTGRVHVEVGGLAGGRGDDFVQADAGTSTIHLNLEWMNQMSKILVSGASTSEACRHHAMLVCQLLHGYLNLYTHHIAKIITKEVMGISEANGKNLGIDGRRVDDLGITGDDLLFRGHVRFNSFPADPFCASLPTSFVLTDAEGNGVWFLDEDAEMIWVDTILEAALPEAVDLTTFFRPSDASVEPLMPPRPKRKCAVTSAEPCEEELEVPSDSDEWGWQHARPLPQNKHFKS